MVLLRNRIVVLFFFALVSASPLFSQDAPVATSEAAIETDAAENDQDDAETAKRHAAFKEQLTGSALVGRFTTKSDKDDGKDLKEERYDILSVKKLKNGDFWVIKTRIRYGERDLTVPVPVEVKWAGDIPVIQLKKVPVPFLGTFDAHVLINGNQYAGTWRHDEVGGHLFGRIETAGAEEEEQKAEGIIE